MSLFHVVGKFVFLHRFIERLVVTDEAASSMDGTVNTINAPEGNVYKKKHTKKKAFCVGRTLR